MQLKIGATLYKFASSVQAVKHIVKSTLEAKLKLYFNFKSSKTSELGFVGTGSCQFEGNDDEIQISDHPSLDGMDQLTIMCWFKYDSTCDNAGNLISKEHDDAYQLQVDTTNKRLQWFVNNVSDSTTSSSIQLGKWHHAACTYDSTGSGTGKMYVDGKLDQTDTTFSGSTIGANAHPLYFGGDSDSTTNFGGFMKNVGMWKRVLSESEIQNIMYKTYEELGTTETTHMLGWWPLEVNGDSSYGTEGINKFDGTASGHVTFSRYNKGQEAAPRKPRSIDNDKQVKADSIGSGSAFFDLDSSENFVLCQAGTNTGHGAENFTCTAWMKIDSSQTQDTHGRIAGGGHADWQLHIQDSDTSPEFYINNNLLESGHTLTDNTWHHLAATYTADGTGTAIIYVDGVKVAEDTSFSGSAIGSSGKYFVIGADDALSLGQPHTQGFGGNICQVGIWKRVLSHTEIQSIKDKTYTQFTDSEKANIGVYYPLDSIGGTTSDGTNLTLGQSVFFDSVNTFTLGSELVNQACNTDPSVWTLSNSSDIEGGVLTVDSVNGGIKLTETASNSTVPTGRTPVASIESGKFYLFSCQFTFTDTTSARIRFYGTTNAFNEYLGTSHYGYFTQVIRGTSTGDAYIEMAANGNGKSISIANCSIKEITAGHPGSFA